MNHDTTQMLEGSNSVLPSSVSRCSLKTKESIPMQRSLRQRRGYHQSLWTLRGRTIPWRQEAQHWDDELTTEAVVDADRAAWSVAGPSRGWQAE